MKSRGTGILLDPANVAGEFGIKSAFVDARRGIPNDVRAAVVQISVCVCEYTSSTVDPCSIPIEITKEGRWIIENRDRYLNLHGVDARPEPAGRYGFSAAKSDNVHTVDPLRDIIVFNLCSVIS